MLKSNSEEWIVHQVDEEGEGREGKGRPGGREKGLSYVHMGGNCGFLFSMPSS